MPIVYVRTIDRRICIAWLLFHVGMSIRRAVQEALTPSKHKDQGRT